MFSERAKVDIWRSKAIGLDFPILFEYSMDLNKQSFY